MPDLPDASSAISIFSKLFSGRAWMTVQAVGVVIARAWRKQLQQPVLIVARSRLRKAEDWRLNGIEGHRLAAYEPWQRRALHLRLKCSASLKGGCRHCFHSSSAQEPRRNLWAVRRQVWPRFACRGIWRRRTDNSIVGFRKRSPDLVPAVVPILNGPLDPLNCPFDQTSGGIQNPTGIVRELLRRSYLRMKGAQIAESFLERLSWSFIPIGSGAA